MDVKGQAAIVTGGGSGLGAATARALAAAGAKVAVFDINDKAAAEKEARAMCEKLLANPVTEDFEIAGVSAS